MSGDRIAHLGAARGAYIDQSQSLNLFMENPNIGQLSSMYMYAWKAGVKTTYYMRSRPATKIAKVTTSGKDQGHAHAASPAGLSAAEPAETLPSCKNLISCKRIRGIVADDQ